MHELKSLDVDIYQYPTEFLDVGPSHLIAHGDAHANLVRLVFVYLSCKVISLEKSDYIELVNLYQLKSNLRPHERGTPLEFEVHNQILAIIAKIKLLKNTPVIYNLGDTVADRGDDCTLIYAFFDRLVELKYKPHGSGIQTSNHDAWAWEYMETGVVNEPARIDKNLQTGQAVPLQGKSLVNSARLMAVDPASEFNENIKRMYNKSYRPMLKIINFTVHDGRGTLYMHAPVSMSIIFEASKELGLDVQPQAFLASSEAFFEFCQRFQNAFVEKYEREGLGFMYANNPKYVNLRRMLWEQPKPVFPQPSLSDIPELGFELDIAHGHFPNSYYAESMNADSAVGKIADPRVAKGKLLLPVIEFSRAIKYYDRSHPPCAVTTPSLLSQVASATTRFATKVASFIMSLTPEVEETLITPRLESPMPLRMTPEEAFDPSLDEVGVGVSPLKRTHSLRGLEELKANLEPKADEDNNSVEQRRSKRHKKT